MDHNCVVDWANGHIKNQTGSWGSEFQDHRPFAGRPYMNEQYEAGKKGVVAVMRAVIKEKESANAGR